MKPRKPLKKRKILEKWWSTKSKSEIRERLLLHGYYDCAVDRQEALMAVVVETPEAAGH